MERTAERRSRHPHERCKHAQGWSMLGRSRCMERGRSLSARLRRRADRSPRPTLEAASGRPSERACGCGPARILNAVTPHAGQGSGEVAQHPDRQSGTAPFPPRSSKTPPVPDGRSKRAAERAPPHRSSSGTNPRAPHTSRTDPGADAQGSRRAGPPRPAVPARTAPPRP
jgi:hypothetical protein